MSQGNSIAARLALPTVALAVFYWSLFTVPGQPGSATVTAEEFRELVEQSKALLGAGKYDEALEAYSRLHQSDPDNHVYLRELATVYGSLNRTKDEIHMWELFLDHAPLPEEACPYIGMAYQKLAMVEQALKAFERCHEFDHNNTDAIFNYALAVERQGDFAQAEKLYRQGVEIQPDYLDLRTGLARAALHQGHPEQASREVAKVLQKEASNVDALLVAGLAALNSGDGASARRYLEQGAKLAPNYEDFKTALARLERQGGGL